MYGTTGYVITIGRCPITWTSKKQSIRVMSSSAAEYVAAATTLDEVLWVASWITSINAQLQTSFDEHPIILTDSAPYIKIVTNRSVERNQSKFIDLRQF